MLWQNQDAAPLCCHPERAQREPTKALLDNDMAARRRHTLLRTREEERSFAATAAATWLSKLWKSLTTCRTCTCTHTQAIQKRLPFQHINVLFCAPMALLDGRPMPRERRTRSKKSGSIQNQPCSKLHVRTSVIYQKKQRLQTLQDRQTCHIPKQRFHCQNDCLRPTTLETKRRSTKWQTLKIGLCPGHGEGYPEPRLTPRQEWVQRTPSHPFPSVERKLRRRTNDIQAIHANQAVGRVGWERASWRY